MRSLVNTGNKCPARVAQALRGTHTHNADAHHSRNHSPNEKAHKQRSRGTHACQHVVYVNRELEPAWYAAWCHCMWLLNTCQLVNTPCPVPNRGCRFNQPSVGLKNKSWRSIPVWLHSLIIVWSSNSEMTERDGPSGCCECNYILTINRPAPHRRVCYMMTYLARF